MAKRLSQQALQKHLNTLSLTEVLAMLDEYAETTNSDLVEAKRRLISDDLQNRLILHNINTSCPSCNSDNICKYGSNGNVKRFKCKDCGKTFTLFTGTMLEKTQYHWEIWVEVIWMVLNNYHLETMREHLINEYNLTSINYKTIFHWVHKIIHALAEIPMPKLSGVIQIDEIFFRENQKGTRELVPMMKGEERQSRRGNKKSKYGVMGNEFANVVVAVNWQGYCVSQVVGLGKLTNDTFFNLFDKYMNNPEYICADGNHVYQSYCKMMNYPLYIMPSNYLDTIIKAGYTVPDMEIAIPKKIQTQNEKILSKLYEARAIDYILGRTDLSYKEFEQMKHMKNLGLDLVSQFKNELKLHLEENRKGVATKYLQDYVGYYTFIRNWSVMNEREPNTRKDAEDILIAILKGKVNYTTAEMQKADMPENRVSDKYMATLKRRTEEMRTLTNNKHFQYDEEDNVVDFDKKEYLLQLPDYKLKKLCTKYKVPQKLTKYAKINELLKNSTIWEDILLLINEDKATKNDKK